jgi:hypothetical protein
MTTPEGSASVRTGEWRSVGGVEVEVKAMQRPGEGERHLIVF